MRIFAARLSALVAFALVASAQSDPLLEKTKLAVQEYASSLPDYVCQESMERFEVVGFGVRSREVRLDTVTAEVVYERGHETFRNLRVNGKSVEKASNGIWSSGVFGPMMMSLFDPRIGAEIRRRGTSRQMGRSAVQYDFAVAPEKSNWEIMGQNDKARPAYRGTIWVDAATGQILRHEMKAVKFPPKFFYRDASMSLRYGPAQINGREYLLPRQSVSELCPSNASSCNELRAVYSDCRKFGSESTLKFDSEN